MFSNCKSYKLSWGSTAKLLRVVKFLHLQSLSNKWASPVSSHHLLGFTCADLMPSLRIYRHNCHYSLKVMKTAEMSVK